jgi:hypothetical protein
LDASLSEKVPIAAYRENTAQPGNILTAAGAKILQMPQNRVVFLS